MSIINHKGEISKIKAKITPIGFNDIELIKFPSITLRTERVDPHDGQGI